MDLRQLRYFAAIAEEQSFTKAAQKLHISQPPLSQQLSNLEDDLGVRLFIRTSRSVQLSEAGSVLLPHVHAVLDRLDEARLQVQRVAQGLEGCVTLGLTGSHFLGTLPQFIREFRQERPRVDVSLKEMPPADQLTGLQDRRLDLCLSRGIPADPAFSAELLWHDSSVVVLPPRPPAVASQAAAPARIEERGFRLLPPWIVHLCRLGVPSLPVFALRAEDRPTGGGSARRGQSGGGRAWRLHRSRIDCAPASRCRCDLRTRP